MGVGGGDSEAPSGGPLIAGADPPPACLWWEEGSMGLTGEEGDREEEASALRWELFPPSRRAPPQRRRPASSPGRGRIAGGGGGDRGDIERGILRRVGDIGSPLPPSI